MFGVYRNQDKTELAVGRAFNLKARIKTKRSKGSNLLRINLNPDKKLLNVINKSPENLLSV